MNFQQLLLAIQGYWGDYGCVLQQPYDMEVGAGTMHPDTFFRVLGPEPWNVGYCQPSRRPVDGRFGENPMRLYRHYQYQVILKPAPLDVQQLYLDSLRAFGVDPLEHDIRFEEDNWESPTLGAAGVGWQVVMDGMEISQFTYFQQAGGIELTPISVELTYGMERICMFINDIRNVYDIPWNASLNYGAVRRDEEIEHSVYSFRAADVPFLQGQFDDWEREALRLVERADAANENPEPLVLPALEATLRCSHFFNVLDARGAFSVTERATCIQRIRRLACRTAAAYLARREALGFPLIAPGKFGWIMSRAPLLIEIGSEEIPARMIRPAAEDLGRLVGGIIEKAGLDSGAITAWGGCRRLAVRVEDVAPRQADRDEVVLGPPAKIAFDSEGRPTPAASGFARKQEIDPSQLEVRQTAKGAYAGFERTVRGKTVGEILADALPPAVGAMSFPKTMRWADGTWRWVRPVHWLIALHGDEVLPVELFGIRSGNRSVGHRFLCTEPVPVSRPGDYREALEKSFVVADPADRRKRLNDLLNRAAADLGGRLVEDPSLLDEVADLLEWPGVVPGKFDRDYMELPRELLVTTLRHHQKCFSVQDESGKLLPCFVAVANTDRDPGSHIRRGNEWVIGGRLEDARFFWKEDRRRTLGERSADLTKVVYHARLGSYAEKAERMAAFADGIAVKLGLDDEQRGHCLLAARLAKNDLVTGTVGEFPELQGQIGGLMIEAESGPAPVGRGVYEHYQPAGLDDDVPSTIVGGVVSIADKLDAVSGLVRVGQLPTGSKDPFGLRRAGTGIFRIVIENGWPLSLDDLSTLTGERDDRLAGFLFERFQKYLREAGSSINEILAVFRPAIDPAEAFSWPLQDVAVRLAAIRTVRQREDFARLVELTKRVDNILAKGAEAFESARTAASGSATFEEQDEAALQLWKLVEREGERFGELERDKRYGEVVDILAGFVAPVDRFFETVLVLDPEHPEATLHRRELLARLRGVLTRCYDIRELAGEANRRAS